MSTTKGTEYHHLTPQGWELGTFKGGLTGESCKVKAPKDRVLTIKRKTIATKTGPSAYDMTIENKDKIKWKSKDKNHVKKLIDKFGDL